MLRQVNCTLGPGMLRGQLLLFALVVSTSAKNVKLVAPELDDGDLSIGTWALPELYKCDACRAVAHQVAVGFAGLKSKPTEQAIFDALEAACSPARGMKGYGITAVGADAQSKALSGPGLPARTAGTTTVAQFADENFPGRMSRFCSEVVGDAGEEGLFEEYQANANLTDSICRQHTRHCRRKPIVEKREKDQAKRAKEAQNKASAQIRREAEKVRKLAAKQNAEQEKGGFGHGANGFSRLDKLEMVLARVEATQKAMKNTLCAMEGAKSSKFCTQGVDIVQNLNIKMQADGSARVGEDNKSEL